MIIYKITAKVFARDASSLTWQGTLGEIAAANIEEAIDKAKVKLVGDNTLRGQQNTPIVRITKIEEVREELEAPVNKPPQAVQPSEVVEAPVKADASSPFPRPRSSTGQPISDQDWAVISKHLQNEVFPLLERTGVKITGIDPSHFFAYLICEQDGKTSPFQPIPTCRSCRRPCSIFLPSSSGLIGCRAKPTRFIPAMFSACPRSFAGANRKRRSPTSSPR